MNLTHLHIVKLDTAGHQPFSLSLGINLSLRPRAQLSSSLNPIEVRRTKNIIQNILLDSTGKQKRKVTLLWSHSGVEYFFYRPNNQASDFSLGT